MRSLGFVLRMILLVVGGNVAKKLTMIDLLNEDMELFGRAIDEVYKEDFAPIQKAIREEQEKATKRDIAEMRRLEEEARR